MESGGRLGATPHPATSPIGRALPPTLTGRQRSLYERLADHDATLSAMYAGAVVVVESDSPDSLAQAAHSARELIANLVRLPTQPSKGTGNPRDKGRELRQLWERYKRANEGVAPDEFLGRPIDRGLLDVLRKVEEFVEASFRHKPDRKAQAERALDELGLSDADLPADLRAADVSEWVTLWTFFEKASHHGSVLTTEALRAHLGRLEDFLMRLIPETFADLDEIDELIGGGPGA